MTKVTFNTKDLLKAIDCCNSSIEKKGTMPILTSILFDIRGSNALLNSMNYETSTVVNIEAKNESGEESKVTIPATYIYNICKLAKSEEIIIEYENNSETNSMQTKITAGKTNYTVSCFDSKDFPAIPTTEKEFKPVNISKIIALLKKVQISLTDVNVNRNFAGIFFKKVINEDGTNALEMVTTDRHRVSVVNIKNYDLDISEAESGFIVQGKNCVDISKIFADSETAEIAIDDDKIFIKSANVTFISKIIKSEFLDYKKITGKYSDIKEKDYALVDCKELAEAIKRITILTSSDNIWASRYTFSGNMLNLTSSSESGGNSSDEILLEKGFEEEKAISVNAKYLSDVIGVLDDKNARIIFDVGFKPMIIEEESDQYIYVHMIMPLRQ